MPVRLLLSIALTIAAASSAIADDTATAAAHYKQGKAFCDAHAYDQAIAEYQQAYALDHVAAHLFNIGRAFHLKGDLEKAIDHYRMYLAAEPTSGRASEVRSHIATATQALAAEHARQRAAKEAARIAAEQEKARADEDHRNRQRAAVAHVKQAEAYARAGAWVQAGEEHRAAATADGDPRHLLDAGEAFRMHPDQEKARDAFRAYLDQVPLGDDSDRVRAKVAEITRAIEKAAADERARALRESSPAVHAARAASSRRGRVDLAVGPESSQGAADPYFGVGIGFRLGLAVAVGDHLFVRGGVHLVIPTGGHNKDSQNMIVSTYAFDAGLGLEGRWPVGRGVDLVGGGAILYGEADQAHQAGHREWRDPDAPPGRRPDRDLQVNGVALAAAITAGKTAQRSLPLP